MRTWQLTATGLDHLQLVDRPTPEPGEHDVVVRIRAASINYRDWMIASGTYRMASRYPVVPLSDGAGDIVAVGRKVANWRVSDRVTTSFFTDWIDGAQTPAGAATALGGAIDGVLAEAVVLPAHGVIRTPAHLSDIEAATLPCAAVTAWHALFEGQDPVRPGHSVVLEGTGGVSVFGLQLAKLAGARTIVTSSSDAKLERGKGLGADSLINYKSLPDWDKEVLRRTDGVGVDHIVEVGGANTLEKSMNAVRPGGSIYVIGSLAGAGTINPRIINRKELHLHGVHVGSREMFNAMNRAVSLARLRPPVDRIFSFAEAKQAYAHHATGGHFGKIVIAVQ